MVSKISEGIEISVETFYQPDYSNPVSGEFMFAYRINIGWWVFVVAGLAAVMVAMLTISFQAIKAAVSNPVNSLRTE